MRQPVSGVSSLRIDQWLWFARIAKTRTLAQALIERGKVRINRVRIDKSSQLVTPGDVVTIALGPRVRVLQISTLGNRRGPASEAAHLYVELTAGAGAPKPQSRVATPESAIIPAEVSAPAFESPLEVVGVRPQGAGRPTKRDRRAIERLKGGK